MPIPPVGIAGRMLATQLTFLAVLLAFLPAISLVMVILEGKNDFLLSGVAPVMTLALFFMFLLTQGPSRSWNHPLGERKKGVLGEERDLAIVFLSTLIAFGPFFLMAAGAWTIPFLGLLYLALLYPAFLFARRGLARQYGRPPA
jgi:hypothetical protein